ncbi:hypothetical protein [Jatrophihabitans sp.]|uniref:hypothetical protein n=1 Tax=Jatrophihabitans sp. TaxID=1932789 RepID=UPI0030C744F8|nr:hypothetical protein [Jatrophihabitans sp.]
MTFQPPPPPPPQGPPPPPPGNWGPPPGQPPAGGGSFDPKSVNSLDWAILGAGVLAFIFSTFSYYTVSASYAGYTSSGSESAWNGFFGWFAALLAVIGAAAVALTLFQPNVKLPLPNRVISVLAFGLATICVILALFVYPGNVPDLKGLDRGHGFGFWISFIVIIAGLVLSLMRAQQTNTALPGPLSNIPKIGK